MLCKSVGGIVPHSRAADCNKTLRTRQRSQKEMPMCRFIAALLGSIVMSITLAAAASEAARSINAEDNSANRSNHEQLSRAGIGPPQSARLDSNESARLDINAGEIGVLFFRRDGDDPKELRVDDSTLVYITGRMGAGRTYQNGRQIEIHPALMESIRQIAMQQFRMPGGTQVSLSELPPAAKQALVWFLEGRATPKVMFARATSREDTARVSELRATKILITGASLKVAHPTDVVELVRTAMLIFGLKSDACDGAGDSRCDRPGVREAFAQIKREEALQRASTAR
jgi:hypothetical protein